MLTGKQFQEISSLIKRKFKFYLVFSLSLIAVFMIIYKLTFYTPPFLDYGKRNFIEKPIDFFWFGWHITKGSIYSNYLKNNDKTYAELGKAGWYRKIYIEKRFHVNKDELISILDLYKNLKLNSLSEKLYIFLMKENKIDVNFLREAGETFIIRKNWKMAAQAFSGIVESNPNDFISHYYLGFSYLRMKEINTASIHFEKVIELNPDLADAYYYLGYAAEKEKNWEKAKVFFEKAINISPNHSDSIKALKKVNKKLE
jgi:tetratricopeptide (TPR) repeat protein